VLYSAQKSFKKSVAMVSVTVAFGGAAYPMPESFEGPRVKVG
jgi:hypothetical protein